MRISDWSSDVCSSDLPGLQDRPAYDQQRAAGECVVFEDLPRGGEEPVLLNRLSTADLVRKASVGWGVVPETCDVSPIFSWKSSPSRVIAGLLGVTIIEAATAHLPRLFMRFAGAKVGFASKRGLWFLVFCTGQLLRH